MTMNITKMLTNHPLCRTSDVWVAMKVYIEHDLQEHVPSKIMNDISKEW